MNTQSRIEIYNNTDEKPTVIQPPAGREFTGDSYNSSMNYTVCVTAKVSTAKEQRKPLMQAALKKWFMGNPPDADGLFEDFERIFAEYLKETE